MLSISLTLHILAAVVWVGGLFFSYVLLRPALATIDAETMSNPLQLLFWSRVLKKFFPWVWMCIVILLATGFLMISLTGGFSGVGNHVYIMMFLGVIMMGIFKFIYVAPFKHLCRGIEEEKWDVAAYAMGTIRQLVMVNLILGFLTIAIATGLAGKI
jgi:uncharacterized membrane protein